jgi:L-cystine transport system permease protein
MGSYFDGTRFVTRIGQILPYVFVNFRMVFWAMLLGTILAVFVAILRIKKIPVVNQLLLVFISFMRGTPLLVQMCLAFYGIPIVFGKLFLNVFGINLNRFDAYIFVIIAFILNEAAFLGEIFRSAILAIPILQTEACYSIGMTKSQTLFRVVLPQAVHVAIPQYGADLIGVFHNTSIAFTLGVLDMMARAKTLGVSTGHTIEGFVVVALIYIVISLSLKGLFKLLEKKLEFGRG